MCAHFYSKKKNKYVSTRERKNGSSPYFSDGVVELSGSDDHLHLKDVAFGHAPLHQALQHLLLIQPEKNKK